jgi:L-alanine-DL-glutamate epimerase-like enolase superfamily enzyme
VIAAPLPYRDGCVEAPAGPGLGVEVDVEKVERYAARREVSSPDRARPAEEVST